jgi:putative heme-binding domain-containing protein
MTQGYETYNFAMADGRVFSGFIVSEGAKLVQIREASGATHELDKTEVEERQRQDTSAMPDGIAASLTPEELADFVSYLQSLTP